MEISYTEFLKKIQKLELKSKVYSAEGGEEDSTVKEYASFIVLLEQTVPEVELTADELKSICEFAKVLGHKKITVVYFEKQKRLKCEETFRKSPIYNADLLAISRHEEFRLLFKDLIVLPENHFFSYDDFDGKYLCSEYHQLSQYAYNFKWNCDEPMEILPERLVNRILADKKWQ